MQEISRNVTICHEARHRSRSVSRPRRRETPWRNVVRCHVLSCFPYRHRRSTVRFLHILAPSRSAPLRRRRVPLSRVSRAGAPVGAGAVRAPDCARAQGSRRAHFSCLFPLGLFSAPAAVLRRKGKGGPRKPPLPAIIIPHFLTGQAMIEKYFQNIANKLLSSDGSAEIRRDAPRGRPSVPVIPDRLRVGPVGRDEAVVPLFQDLHLDRDSLQSARDKRS